MISTIHFTHGTKTCASEPGVFCRWLGRTHFGTNHVCMLFGDKLYDEDGWLQRCPQCMYEFEGETWLPAGITDSAKTTTANLADGSLIDLAQENN